MVVAVETENGLAVASIDVRYVRMKTMGLIMTVGGWLHRLAALVGRLATSAKPYKRKIKEDDLEEGRSAGVRVRA